MIRKLADGALYGISKVDALQAAAAATGIKLQLTLMGPAPAWATKDGMDGANQPAPVEFAASVRAAATRFPSPQPRPGEQRG